MIILTVLFSRSFETMADKLITETYTSNLGMISTLYKQMRFNSVPVAAQLFEDPLVQDYLFHRKDKNEVVLKVLPIIDNIVSRNGYIHSIYLYNGSYGYISTYAGYEGQDCSSDPSLPEYLKNGATRTLLFDRRKTTFSENSTSITLKNEETENLYSLSNARLSDNPDLSYALVVNFSESAAREMFTLQAKDATEDFYIINGDGFFISHPDAEKFSVSSLNDPIFIRLAKEKATSGSIMIKGIDDKQYLACWNDQTEMRWRLIYLIPYDRITGSIRDLKLGIVALAILILSVSLIMLVFISFRLDKSLDLEKRLLSFLKGEGKQRTLPFNPSQDISLVMLRLGNKTQNKDQQEQAYAVMKIGDWLYTFLKVTKQRDYLLYLENNTYCFISYQKPEAINEKIQQANTLVTQQFRYDITSLMSSKQYPLEELPAKLHCLRKKMRVLYLYRRGSIHFDCDLVQGDSTIEMADTTNFIQALRKNDVSLYEKATEEIFENLYKQTSFEYFLALSLNLGLLVQHYFTAPIDLFYPGGSIAWYNEVLSCEEFSQLRAIFSVIGEIMKESNSLSPKDYQKELVIQMKSYIMDNIHDKNLNAALVADQFNLSVNYVRVQYKQYEGMSINETIASCRLEKAVRLLEETELNVNDIREKVGFGNYSYFCTYFKNIKGLSPMQYRTLHRKNNIL